MKTVSIINYKGGVGKTTITTNLAAELAHRGKKVLIIDLDPQTNLTFSFVKVDDWHRKYEDKQTIKSWFDEIIDDGKPKTSSFENLIIDVGNIDLICSHLGLIDVDIELAVGLSASTERQHKHNYIKTYSYLKNELDRLRDKYDIVLFDCPPNFSVVTRNALIASDYYVVPAKMDYLSTLGINQLRNNVNQLVKLYNSYSEFVKAEDVNPEFLGVVATMIMIRNDVPIRAHQSYINSLEGNGIPVFSSMIRENKTLYADAPEYGVPVVLQTHASGTYRDVVSELETLTTEFIRKVGI